MQIEIIETTIADRPLMTNLYQYYMYDFSDLIDDMDLLEDGRYSIDDLGGYWVNPWNHVFLLKVDDKIAGFALVDEPNDAGKFIDMAEFFILRKFRKSGIGEYFARQMFDRFRGQWRVSEIHTNTGAIAFWRKVIRRYTNGQFEEKEWEGRKLRGIKQYFDNSPQ